MFTWLKAPPVDEIPLLQDPIVVYECPVHRGRSVSLEPGPCRLDVRGGCGVDRVPAGRVVFDERS